jgi:Fe-only nitrogenase accessory protein AnfO
MIKEIAVYVNSVGEVTDFNENGIIKVFAKDKSQWNVVRELYFECHMTEKNKDISSAALNIAEALENCKIFVAKKFPDFSYIMLDSMGVSTWKMDGDPNNFLEYILEKEEEEAEVIKQIDYSNYSDKKQEIGPIEIGNNGYYILNLKELQEHNTGITSKQALKPFLNNKNFDELIVTCSHIPNWLEGELIKLNLNFQFSKTGQSDYVIIINKK